MSIPIDVRVPKGFLGLPIWSRAKWNYKMNAVEKVSQFKEIEYDSSYDKYFPKR